MFCPQPNDTLQKENLQVSKRLPFKKINRRRKYHNKQGHKKHVKKDNLKLVFDMSKWAENFTVAATWQLKHQVAYWKARAKALEYENGVLHDVIRRNQGCAQARTNTNDVLHDVVNQNQDHPRCRAYTEEIKTEAEVDHYISDDIEEGISDLDEDVVVSEEYIQYLAANFKYKEDARRERELLRAKQEAEDNALNNQEEVHESVEEKRERFKELYGDQWQRISALEMSVMSNFISECDKTTPVYWPNIPFNFNYS